MFVVVVNFTVKPEHLSEFQTAILKQAENSLEYEEDCHTFDVCISPDNPYSILLYEVYTDRASFNHHLTTLHFQSFNQTVEEWVAEKSVTTWSRLP